MKNELSDALSKAAITFISRAHNTFEETMTVGVGQIAEAAKLDRVALWRNFTREDGEHGEQIYRWDRVSGGTTEPTSGLADIHYSKLAPVWADSFLKGIPVNGPISEIQSGEVLKSFGVVSAYIQPVFISGWFWGVVIFEDRSDERYFGAEEADMLRSAAFLCVNTVIREDMEREIIEAEVAKRTREADELVRKAEKSARLMFDLMPLCGSMWNKDLSILDCNQETVKVFGLPDKLKTLEMFYKMSPEYQPDGRKTEELVRERLTEAFNGEEGYSRFEWMHRTLNGEPIPCEITLVRSEFNGEAVVLSYIRDLREQKKMLAAQAASYAKTAFLSNMSHEIRTPLNAIIGMTAIGKKSDDAERKDYALEKIGDASVHLLGIINDVLDVSKIEANKFELSPIEFNFERMLQRIISMTTFRMDEKHHNFTFSLDKAVPRFIISDDQRLSQVIMNLLSNAVKFTPAYGDISLGVRLLSEENGVCELYVEVTDTGIGVSDEQKKRLFQTFVQAESGISREFGGTGIGLALSKKIVELMDGEINMESEPGKGAKVSFTVKAERGYKNLRSMLSPEINWSNIRVLTVDDEPEVLEFFTDLFDHIGVVCDTAADGFEACRLVEERDDYDVYFIDWRMPGMDGIELARKINARKSEKSYVVVIITSQDLTVIQNSAEHTEIYKYLLKPLFSSAIIDCINECLGNAAFCNQEAAADESCSFDGKKMLLAEDIEINRVIVESLLEDTGIEIECAENGREAFGKVRDNPGKYDVVLMDVQMPQMDGLEATRMIRGLSGDYFTHLPIIAMTANVFKEDIEKCLAAGMDDHIGKPLDMEEVYDKLNHFLKPSVKAGI